MLLLAILWLSSILLVVAGAFAYHRARVEALLRDDAVLLERLRTERLRVESLLAENAALRLREASNTVNVLNAKDTRA